MQFLKNLLAISAASLMLASCNNVEFKKTKTGVPYKVFSSGKGDLMRPEYIVKFEVIQKIKDSVLFSTYQQGAAQYIQIPPANAPMPTTTYADIKGAIIEVFSKARKGDSIYMVQKVDSLLRLNPELSQQKILEKGGEIITTVRILDFYKTPDEANAAISKEKIANFAKTESDNLERFKKDTTVQAQMVKDNSIIEAYLASHNIQAQKTNWGVYVQTIDPGTGPKANPGQFMSIKYKGTSLEGETFDEGVYPLQIGMGGSIKGFEEAVKNLSKGGKAKAFVPSYLGYGPQGSAPKIKPFQVLVFDVEILDITDKQPAPQMPQPVDSTKK